KIYKGRGSERASVHGEDGTRHTGCVSPRRRVLAGTRASSRPGAGGRRRQRSRRGPPGRCGSPARGRARARRTCPRFPARCVRNARRTDRRIGAGARSRAACGTPGAARRRPPGPSGRAPTSRAVGRCRSEGGSTLRARFSPTSERTTTVLLLGAMVGLVLWRALPFLGPVPEGGLYNSDSAVPVLMSNLATGAPVDWLFWGQDRFGSWRFLLARAAGALTHWAWTPHGMHVLRTLWMVGALVPWLALAGRARAVAAAGLLLLPGLNLLLERVLVDLGTVDGWQVPTLLWAWWALRGAAIATRPGGWVVLAVVAGALATWTSLVSAPLLAVLAGVEGTAAAAMRRRVALLLPAL